MNDVPLEKGRSQVVSRDVRAAVKKIKPAIMRTILGNDRVVEYMPVAEGDEETAQQATDYINFVVVPECNLRAAIEDAADDALKGRTGILTWGWEEKRCVSVSEHSGLDDMALAMLAGDDDVEVLEHSTRSESVDQYDEMAGGMVQAEQAVHDVRIRRERIERRPYVRAIKPEDFLIDDEAVSFDAARLIGTHERLTRSDLIAMGYDAETVNALPIAGSDDREQDIEEDARRREALDTGDDANARAMQEVDYYELYVRADYDGDGIAEIRRICMAGGTASKNILKNDEVDCANFAPIRCERLPHQWEGVSVADDAMEIQKIKTVLLRQTLDNLYWQNKPQPIVQEGSIKNPEAVLNPDFGLPIRVGNGMKWQDAVGFRQVPFMAKESFAMLAYLDEELSDRTGISDASSGLAPDALQNMTAKATALIEQGGIGQTEMMVRTLADDLKPVFRGLLKIIIQHQDKPRTIRLRNEWVTFDPRAWNAEMDATVNTGLGAGTRERDMAMMQLVIGMQEKLFAAFGPDNPFVSPDNLYAALSRLVESAGLKTPDMYFNEPDPQEVAARLQAERSKPDPEQVKLQAQMQIEQAKMQASTARERAQMEADLMTKEKDRQMAAEAEQRKLAHDAALNEQKMAHETAMEQMRIEAQAQLAREKMAHDAEMARAKQEAEARRADLEDLGNLAQSIADSGAAQ
jgi:hypothetical protein